MNASIKPKVTVGTKWSGTLTGADVSECPDKDPSPIVPADNSGKMWGVIAAAMFLQALIYYFFFVRR